MHLRKTSRGWLPVLSEAEHLKLDRAKGLADLIAEGCQVPNGALVDNDLRGLALELSDTIDQFQAAIVVATRAALGLEDGLGGGDPEPAELETAED